MVAALAYGFKLRLSLQLFLILKINNIFILFHISIFMGFYLGKNVL